MMLASEMKLPFLMGVPILRMCENTVLSVSPCIS